jgi:hypothetical protein
LAQTVATELGGRPAAQAQHARQLQVLAGRLLCAQGWQGAEAHAYGEELWTGRPAPYAASTVRKRARALAHAGATAHADAQVREQVHAACREDGGAVWAYTDLFDQVYWTKKPAHAGPVGRLGNRCLGAMYQGMTFVRAGQGPALGYALSWHKPAAPLQDALGALYDGDTARRAWLLTHAKLHVWDRGGCGAPTLRWAVDRGIPYLTIAKARVEWTAYEHPRVFTAQGVPVFVRPDADLFDWQWPRMPREVIFPAKPHAGTSSTRALRFRTAADLADLDLAAMDVQYKTRWPCNENAIKELLTVGFGLNRERRLVSTTSRGTDGTRTRLAQSRQAVTQELHLLQGATDKASGRKRATRQKRLVRLAEAQKKLEAKAPLGARPESATEMLCKWIQLWLVNALRLALWRSRVPALQALGLVQLRRLLLERPAWVVLDLERITVCVDPLRSTREIALQQQLVKVFNTLGLRLGDRVLHFRLKPPIPSAKSQHR